MKAKINASGTNQRVLPVFLTILYRTPVIEFLTKWKSHEHNPAFFIESTGRQCFYEIYEKICFYFLSIIFALHPW